MPVLIFFFCLYLCRALTFVYPYGATLSVMKPAVAVLSTGSVCFPLNRPVLAFHQGKVRGTITFLFSFPDRIIFDYACEIKDVLYVGSWQTGSTGFLPYVQ